MLSREYQAGPSGISEKGVRQYQAGPAGINESLFSGTAALTESGEALAASGKLIFSGTAALTESGEALAASGKEKFTGTAALTESGEALAASGKEKFTGTAALTESGEALAATGASAAIVPATGGGELKESRRRRPRLRWSEDGNPDPVRVFAPGVVLRIEFGNAGVVIQARALASSLSCSWAGFCSISAGAVATSTSERRAPRASLQIGIENGARVTRPSETHLTRVRAVRNPSEVDLMLTHLSLIE